MQKFKKIVLFDIDRTIFDTDKYLTNLLDVLGRQMGYPAQEFYEVGKKSYKKLREALIYLDPKSFLDEMVKHARIPTTSKKLEKIFWDKALYETCIYPDVNDVFDYLNKNNFMIGIFSTGDIKHQKIKIESLKEYLLINHIYISDNKLKIVKETFGKYKNHKTYLIDDFPDILIEAKKHNKDITTVWIRRSKTLLKNVLPNGFNPNVTISNLDELIPILK